MHKEDFTVNRKKFFTLIELLVVIAIIAILAAILMPALSQARERGKSATCINNMKTLGLATMGYQEDFNGWYFPCYFDTTTTKAGTDAYIGNRAPRFGQDQGSIWVYKLGTHPKRTSQKHKGMGYIQGDMSTRNGKTPLLCPNDTDPRRGTSKAEGAFDQCYYSYKVNSFIAGATCAEGSATKNGIWMNLSNWGHHSLAKKPSQAPLFVDADNNRNSGGSRIPEFSTGGNLDPADPSSWVLQGDTTKSNPGNAGARHNESISTGFADGHAKLIRTPIPNSHTTGNKLYWAYTVYPDRTDLN